MRWPEGPPHLTLEPSKKNTKQQKRKKKRGKKNKNKRTQKYPKKSFSVISHFFLFWWVSRISLFDNLAKKARTQKNTIKIGVSTTHFLDNSFASRNGHFWTKENQIQKFQLSVFGAFFFSFNNRKHTKNC